jgi:hypothetical protein
MVLAFMVAALAQDPLEEQAAETLRRELEERELAEIGTLTTEAVADEELPPEVRLLVAERLLRRAELAPVEQVLSSLARIRRDAPALAARTEAVETRLRRRERPSSVVEELPPARRPLPPAESGRPSDAINVNVLLGFGAIALAAVLIATRRHA